MSTFPIFTGKEESVAVTIEPHYEVEVRVSHTISRRVCMTGISMCIAFGIVLGICGFVAYAIIARGHQ